MPFKKGISGNSKGRPPKARILTDLLALRGQQEVNHEGQTLPVNSVIAAMMWDFLINGYVEFPNGGKVQAATASEWFLAAKWIYDHIDGPARSEVDAGVEIHIVREDEAPERLRDGD